MKILGIDEAGRGPIIGPLVITGAIINQDKENSLKELGVKDSKLIAPAKRKQLCDILVKKLKYHTQVIEASEIDAALDSKNLNLNWLEAIKSVEIIRTLKPDIAILDCPSTNTQAYKEYVKDRLKKSSYTKDIRIIVEHKADVKYPIVSAASIIAKVTRDRYIESLHIKYGNFGSGYPSDPKTQRFVRENFNRLDIFRKTWETYKRLIREKKQKKLGEF